MGAVRLLQAAQPVVFGDGTMQEPFRDYQRERAQEFSDHIDQAIELNPHSQYMLWRDEWTPGTLAEPHEVYTQGGFVMVCVRETNDPPAPQLQGSPFFISGLGDTPAWTNDSDTAGFVSTGQRYTIATAKLALGFRVWPPVADPLQLYQVFIINNPAGVAPIVELLTGEFSVTTVEWFDVATAIRLLPSGGVFDLVIAAASAAIPVSTSALYTYKRSNGPPSSGEINHQSNNTNMRIHHTDKDGIDRQALLEGLSPGDGVSGGGIEWLIVTSTLNANDVDFEVTPATRAQEGDFTMQFTAQVAASVPSVSIAGHFSGNAEVEGRKGVDTLTSPTLNQNAYGVDIFVQDVIASPDWKLVSFNG